MKSKKRYVIGFWIAAALVVILSIGMVAVLSAFTATAQSGFNISYTAIHVNATVTGQYKGGSLGTTTKDLYNNANTSSKTLDFNTTDSESVTASFKQVTSTDVRLSKSKDIYIIYTISNKDTTNAINLVGNVTTNTGHSNVNIYYSTTSEEADQAFTSSTSVITIAKATSSSTPTSQRLYIRVSIADTTKSATFNAGFSFVLTSATI